MPTVVITGAAGGIGRAIVREFVTRGYTAAVTDINASALDELVKNYPGSCTAFPANLADAVAIPALFEQIEQSLGQVEVLVNCAGMVNVGRLEEWSEAQIEREIQVNFAAVVRCCRAVIPAMKARRRGTIITVCSMAAFCPLEESALYAATKFGVRGLMLSLHEDLRRSGIHACLVHPGSVDTPLLRRECEQGGSPLNFVSEPLKPEQVARAVIQLIRKPRPEICLPSSERFLAEFSLWFPKLADALKPTLVSIGKRRMAAYLATSAQDEHKASLRGSS